MSSLEIADLPPLEKVQPCAPERLPGEGLVGELGRSLVVSLAALLVDYGLMIALYEWGGLHHLPAAAAGFCAGLTTNYALSVGWVFRARTVANRWLEFGIFAAIGVAGLGWTIGIMYLGVDLWRGEYWLVRIIAVGAVFGWNFGVRKLALFRASGQT